MTKYNMVKKYIQSKILDETYTAHEKISSESELMKKFNVSRHTVRQAIGELVAAGWLYREQGSGTFVADRSKRMEANQRNNQKSIAIVTTYISEYIFTSIIRGAEARLREEGYQVSIFSTNNNHENERMILEKILDQQFDGVIVEPTKSAYSNPNLTYYLELEQQSIPYIMINAYYDELEPVNIVMDDEKGGFMQTEHLIELGHRNIIGCFKTDDMQGVRRMKGFLKAHRKHHIPIDPRNMITYTTEDQDTKPAEELDKLISTPNNGITGIVCYNDEIAVKLLNVFREKNLAIPDDISMVGYDDSFLAEISEVKLTSIIHPQSIMGEEAANRIIELIKSKKGKSKEDASFNHSIVYSPEIMIRTSTKALKE